MEKSSRPARSAARSLLALSMLVAAAIAPAVASAALLSQTIAFGALSGKTYGAPPFTVAATASSGLPVSFASLTTAVCAVSASTVTIVAAGTCTIQASQAGDATYAAAPSVKQSFAVAKASQTIAFGALSTKTYGDPPFTLSATASSGLAVTFVSATTAVCTVSGSTVTIVAGGTCSIKALQSGNTKYLAATTVTQSLTVAKASQTITFGALPAKTYGDPPFTVSATASSGLAVTFASATTAVCKVSGGTVTIVAGGTCSIKALQSGNVRYLAATAVTQSFAVAKASQTIAFGALPNQTYGVSPFTVSATASSGLAVTFASLTTAVCTVSGSTVTLRAGGTCTIQARQAGNASYLAAASVNRSFAVAKAPQTITFAALAGKMYGDPPFTVSATASSGLAVTFTSLTTAVCTVSGNTVTIKAVGTCTIEAAQAGNGNYNPAPDVSQSFSVTQSAPVMPGARFSAPVPYGTGSFPEGVATADFDGDGVADVAVANAFSANVSIFLGSGDGALLAVGNVQTGGEPIAVAVGDFDRDRNQDLAVADFFGNRIFILRGNGNGSFAQTAAVALGPAPIAIAVDDLDGDGKLDLIAANGSSGTVTGQSVTVALGNGDGTFRSGVAYATGHSPYAVVVADFNGDGTPDLAVANGDDDTVSILLGRGGGAFAAAVSYAAHDYPDALAVGDFDGDGKLDLAVGNDYSDDVSILLGRGDGTFGPATHASAGSGPASVAVGDFNGDGLPDLAVANRFDDTVAILLGAGDGTFQPPSTYAGLGGQLEAVVAQDLDSDGRPDLVVTSAAGNTVVVLRNASVSAPPASLAVQSGAPQSTEVGTTYAQPLAVAVEDAGGHPLAGVGVTFTAPLSGASGTFAGTGNVAYASSDAAGVAAAQPFTANAVTGSFAVVATVGALTASFALTSTAVVGQAPSFTSAPPPNGAVNVAYRYTVAASGVPTPTFSVTSGALPPGLALNASTGVVGGTPGAGGSFSGTLTASNGVAPAATQAFDIAIALATQTVAFGSLGSRTIGSGTFSLAATASSGLPVGFASLTPAVCTLVGNVVALDTAGTCTIRASQAGNASYAAAPNVDRSFTVARGSQTIGFEPSPTGSADAWTELRATASSGLPVSFSTLTPGVCAVSANLASFIAAGTCTIRASQPGNAAYNAAPSVDRSIAIAGASQRITFWSPDDQPRQASPITVSASASSGLPVTFSSLTTTVCTVSGNQVTLLASGTCSLRATQAGNAQYAAASVDRSFTVTGGTAGQAIAPATAGPFIEYSTYLGGDGSDKAFDVVVGPDGSAYVGGSVASTNFPRLNSAAFTNAGLDLLFVARINPSRGAVDSATVVGGRAADITLTGLQAYVGSLEDTTESYLGAGQAEAMTIDSAGNVYVAAYADSVDYPLRGGTYARTGPKYIFKVASTGSAQAVGAPIDPAVMTIRALAVDASGALYFTGVAGPGLVTTPDAAIGSIAVSTGPLATRTAPYLVKLSPGGTSTAFATYLSVPGSRSGSLPDSTQSMVDAATTAYALTVDAAGNSYLAGQATAVDFPATSGSPDTTDAMSRDAFVAKVNATGTALLFVARLGNPAPIVSGPFGTQGGPDAERATSIALSPDGGIVIGGKTATLPFPGVNAFQPQVYFEDQTPLAERETGFVAKLSSDGKRWIFVDPIGTVGGNLVPDAFLGDVDPYPLKLAVDATGAIYAAGTTYASRRLVNLDQRVVTAVGWIGFVQELVGPVANGLAAAEPNGAFVMKISPDGSAVVYAATLDVGVATGLALDGFGNAFVAGYAPGGLPVVGAAQAAPLLGGGQTTPFVAKLNDHLAPVSLASHMNPGDSAHVVPLVATVADARFAGSIEFADGVTVLGSAPVAGGVATLQASLAIGIHRLRATFHGSGPFDGYASSELIEVVNQAPESP